MDNNIDIKKLLGRRIKELRTKKGLTQEKLAELVGVGERNLSKIECGNNFVTSETLTNILNALEVEPDELFHFQHFSFFQNLYLLVPISFEVQVAHQMYLYHKIRIHLSLEHI